MSFLLFVAVLSSSSALVFGRSTGLFFMDDLFREEAVDQGVAEETGYKKLQGLRRQNRPKGGACILDMNADLPKKNEPLFLHKGQSGSLELLMPEMEGKRGIIALREGEQVLVTCPGNKNFLEATKSTEAAAYCRKGNKLAIDGKDFSVQDLDCNGRASSMTKPTQKRCAGGKGTVVEIGFNVESWIPMVETCHDIENSHTFYSIHTVRGSIIGGKVIRSTGRPMFSRGDKIFFKGFNPENTYAQKNQLAVLERDLGAKNAQEVLDTKKSHFLARGHLAPDADFLFSPHQFLTYFYINVAPQWQSINAGYWLKVEDNTRRRARSLGADLQVVTGTLGVLQLAGQKGPKEIRLQDSRVPVPEFFWKVIRNTQDDSCIAFVASNNPFLTSKPRQICKDICAQTGWPVLQDDYSKGYVYCCQYNDIKKAVPEMPQVNCKSILKGQ